MRNLSRLNYLVKLQEEYFLAYLRKYIYITKKDKMYQKNLMQFKKQKILDISSEIVIGTIFNSQELFKNMKLKIIPLRGLPQYSKFNDKDKKFYFHPEKDVIVYEEGEIIKGVVKENDFMKEFCMVKKRYEKKIIPCSYHNLRLIL